ncbi:MAG: hypothetical protein GQ527_00030, partial [Bacteroidales bacterium]|nr:hypothetical protein [Bacteroidales bacterium]
MNKQRCYMLSIKNSSELLGNYKNLSFPVLLKQNKEDETIVQINDPFQREFFTKETAASSRNSITESILDKVEKGRILHWHDYQYIVDIINKDQGISIYLFSHTKQAVNSSFLWLKHDLLNIINPIMGFSDVLS